MADGVGGRTWGNTVVLMKVKAWNRENIANGIRVTVRKED